MEIRSCFVRAEILVGDASSTVLMTVTPTLPAVRSVLCVEHGTQANGTTWRYRKGWQPVWEIARLGLRCILCNAESACHAAVPGIPAASSEEKIAHTDIGLSKKSCNRLLLLCRYNKHSAMQAHEFQLAPAAAASGAATAVQSMHMPVCSLNCNSTKQLWANTTSSAMSAAGLLLHSTDCFVAASARQGTLLCYC